ncbi:hypothetical protein PR003_g21711 [Phytophthora rubi]|uniref:Uncharacterized protein n=1 Tax=Phytophthora rubi TaxID=129364 RepID=A0A6A4DE63_9STRA|nr:hypothetical protein PR002_g21297 [Phytophthora rubi]KAE9304622.1 hypothetical protein PR003_g21711 [Phytophthora rubi]
MLHRATLLCLHCCTVQHYCVFIVESLSATCTTKLFIYCHLPYALSCRLRKQIAKIRTH